VLEIPLWRRRHGQQRPDWRFGGSFYGPRLGDGSHFSGKVLRIADYTDDISPA